MSHQDQESDYQVGYCKPPLHSRFQKGHSGNPRGRPKRKTIGTVLDKMLSRKVTVTVDGKRTRLSYREMVAHRAIVDAAKGNPRAREWVTNTERDLPEDQHVQNYETIRFTLKLEDDEPPAT